MEKLYKLKDKLFDEMNKVSSEISGKPGLNAGDLEYVHMLTDTVKNIDKICMLEEDAGYSEDGGEGGGSSYANRGRHYVRGHYSREGGGSNGGGQGGYSSRRGGGGRGGYSRSGGYSQEDGCKGTG